VNRIEQFAKDGVAQADGAFFGPFLLIGLGTCVGVYVEAGLSGLGWAVCACLAYGISVYRRHLLEAHVQIQHLHVELHQQKPN
jgi:hypothetical protein